MINKLFKLILHNPFHPGLLVFLLGVNFLGSIYGFWWYRQQLMETSLVVWPLVPDSPLSTVLFSLMLVFFLFGKRITLLAVVACISMIKYGLWAIVLNAEILLAGDEFTLINLMLMLSHLGMALEGFVYLPHLTIRRNEAVLAGVWLVVQDMADYLYGLHPYLFDPRQFYLAAVSAVFLTLWLFGWIGLRARKSANLR